MKAISTSTDLRNTLSEKERIRFLSSANEHTVKSIRRQNSSRSPTRGSPRNNMASQSGALSVAALSQCGGGRDEGESRSPSISPTNITSKEEPNPFVQREKKDPIRPSPSSPSSPVKKGMHPKYPSSSSSGHSMKISDLSAPSGMGSWYAAQEKDLGFGDNVDEIFDSASKKSYPLISYIFRHFYDWLLHVLTSLGDERVASYSCFLIINFSYIFLCYHVSTLFLSLSQCKNFQ